MLRFILERPGVYHRRPELLPEVLEEARGTGNEKIIALIEDHVEEWKKCEERLRRKWWQIWK